MKADEYPLGEPVVLTPQLLRQDSDCWPCPWRGPVDFPYKGLLLVRVEPPQRMPNSRLPPFLPYRSAGGNLLVPRCAKCAELKSLGPCEHNAMQRSWVAAFPHHDIQLALKLGYTVHEVFEVGFFKLFFKKSKQLFKVWHWPEEAWKTGIFADYINAFLKMKVVYCG
jgi:hypothetical protein